MLPEVRNHGRYVQEARRKRRESLSRAMLALQVCKVTRQLYIRTSTINLLDCFCTTVGHFGRDKTVEKICSRFYWKNMYDDIRAFVQRCPKCQQMNAWFIKSNAKLYPIPVEPQVWHQVSVMLYRSILTGHKGLQLNHTIGWN